MSQNVNRRKFLGTAATGSAAIGLGMSTLEARASVAPSDTVVVAVMGLSRGRALANSFAKEAGVVVKYTCDVDSERAEAGAGIVENAVGKKPQAITDYRRILEDKEVDALICAAPNHWHAPATIFACQAGKHVYVEKPCSHNPREGEMMVAAARQHNRAVQMGSQRRSGPGATEAIKKLHDGAIGRVYMARAWYNSLRGSIGHGKLASVPSNLDFELWQGPAPRRPYVDNLVHYNWHWRWHWGNGELGNNGVHTLDLCRWGVGVDYPIRVTSSGGRYHFEDDQETPDTHTVCFDFDGRRSISWHGLSCNKHRAGFVQFYGDDGTLELDSIGTHRVYDKNDKLVSETKSTSQGDREHIVNFLEAIRSDQPMSLNAEIAEGHKSTLLCHLGNISQRVGRSLDCDSKNGHIVGDDAAMALWTRDYDGKFEPRVDV